jgi:site-specific DNA-cytosine methylase
VSVVNALGSSSVPVEFVFVENVKGFEVSGARKMLLEVLQKRDYHVAEFLLCPTQFGIPNSR